MGQIVAAETFALGTVEPSGLETVAAAPAAASAAVPAVASVVAPAVAPAVSPSSWIPPFAAVVSDATSWRVAAFLNAFLSPSGFEAVL